MQLSEYKYETLHNLLLQDKEMTVRHDCDQSECVFLQNITLACWLSLSLCFYSSLLLFKFSIEI